MSLLYVLAEKNMSNLLKVYTSTSEWLEIGNERYGPLLFAALATGSEDAIRTFL